MVKVFLVRTPWEPFHMGFQNIAMWEPLQLEYVSAAVKEHAQVTLWDLWFEKEKKLYASVLKEKPDVVAMSLATIQVYSAIRIAARIKELSPATRIIVGGGAPTLCPGYFRNSAIDLLSIGNGMDTVRNLVLRIRDGKDIDGIEGTARIIDGAMIETKRTTPPPPLDFYGLPDRELTARYRKKYHFYHHTSFASTTTSRGCWNRCNFCSTWMHNGRGSIEVRPLDIVLRDLQNIRENWVFFGDDDIFAAGHSISEMLDGIERLGIKHHYMIEATADDIIRNKDLIKKWSILGLRKVLIGLESPLEEDLRSVEKAASLKQNIEAVRVLRECGVDTIASFILFAHWTKKEFAKLWQFVKENRLYWVHYQCCTPLPGTKMFSDDFDRITNFNLDLYDEEHLLYTPTLSLNRWYWERLKIQMRTYLPWRGRDREVHRFAPLNFLHPLYYHFNKLNIKYLFAGRHHKTQAPAWQPTKLEDIYCVGPTKSLLELKPYTYHDENGRPVKFTRSKTTDVPN